MGLVILLYLLLVIGTDSGELPSKHQIFYMPGYGNISGGDQWSGYIPINDSDQSSLFYWFIESENNPARNPLIIWLNGGPGCSSLIGLFEENGYWRFDPNTDSLLLRVNPNRWTKIGSVLYIDQPVGTGYSFLKNAHEYKTNATLAIKQLSRFLNEWFELFPVYYGNPLYIAGEGYSGKIIMRLAWNLLFGDDSKVNLQGLIIGDGSIDPRVQQLYYPEELYGFGLLSETQKYQLQYLVDDCNFRIMNNYNKKKIAASCEKVNKFIYTVCGSKLNMYDARVYKPSINTSKVTNYMNLPEVRKYINIPNNIQNYSSCDNNVKNMYSDDTWRSILPLIPELLPYIRILLYNGNFGALNGANSIEKTLINSPYVSLNLIGVSERFKWEYNESIIGFFRTHKNLTLMTLANSGDYAVVDQPKVSFSMVSSFISKNGFCNNSTNCGISTDTCAILNNCYGNGVCENAICKCDSKYTGSDCKQKITPINLGDQFKGLKISTSGWKYFMAYVDKPTSLEISTYSKMGDFGLYFNKNTPPTKVNFEHVTKPQLNHGYLKVQIETGTYFIGIWSNDESIVDINFHKPLDSRGFIATMTLLAFIIVILVFMLFLALRYYNRRVDYSLLYD
eukprot:TRINITY_DN8242_c0_g1_i1.p1 TRINITY_DN8242_c0_g1~~TRINITY_DN8242_c0_g1_i1.p1  ORF type:complete len:620 (-),score=104.79 TRINITY_DN8242_c0_g1_i1:47-1906(-)